MKKVKYKFLDRAKAIIHSPNNVTLTKRFFPAFSNGGLCARKTDIITAPTAGGHPKNRTNTSKLVAPRII